MLSNLPLELRLLPQWVVAGENKIPLNPRTKRVASVVDSTTWGSFEEACQAGFRHVGFVIAESDPFTFIDLDRPENAEQWEIHQRILNRINSYTELSQSGQGYHIIVRGKITSAKRDHVELYSESRYMICTGNVVRAAPIVDYQDVLNGMYYAMKPTASVLQALEEEEGEQTDAEIVDKAMRASNADKFNLLCNGDMSDYPSQSEADFALLSIIAFYTKDNEQVRRIFRSSNLGKRGKAIKNDTYLDYALRKIRSNQPAEVDFAAVQERARALVMATVAAIPEPPKVEIPTGPAVIMAPPADPRSIFPPGLVGRVANYIYESAYMPVAEIALAGAMTLFAGVVGRQYNLPATGLNMYTILLARTGTGKEGAGSGINRLIQAVRTTVPDAGNFRGPATFASAPAVVKSLTEKKCQFVILGEFGIWLKDICNTRAMGPNPMLRRALLDLYHKSGWNQILMGTEYSDSTKNILPVQAPCLTILGECTQESFFEGLDSGMVTSGLLPRFHIIEYSGQRLYGNESHGFPPAPELVGDFAGLVATVLQMDTSNTCLLVQFTPEARDMAKAFERKATDIINADHSSGVAEIWNRAHINAIKAAALVAIGNNHHSPVIGKEEMQWAITYVTKGTGVLLGRFKSGDIGEGDSKQLSDLRRIISSYFHKRPSASYGVPDNVYEARVIPYSYLNRKVGNTPSFSTAKLGATSALRTALQALTDSAELQEIPKLQMKSVFKSTMLAYAEGDKAKWPQEVVK